MCNVNYSVARGFVKLNRSDETMELLKRPNAYTLLSLIAIRARRSNKFCTEGLKPGEALIGDYKNVGLSEKKYRIAKKNLEKWGLATFRGTNRGTIAKLTNTEVFDINVEIKGELMGVQRSSKGRKKGGQRATNKNDKNDKNERKSTSTSRQPSVVHPFKKEPNHFKNHVGKWFQSIEASRIKLEELAAETGKRFSPAQWIQQKVKERGHPGAIDQSLSGLIKTWDVADNPWGFANNIFDTVNGNWNEKDAIRIHEELKQMPAGSLVDLTKGILKDI